MTQTELLIIGGGPAGYVGAIRAAQLGMKVTLVEEKRIGGTCLNIGCIPTKSLLSHAGFIYGLKHPRTGVNISSHTLDKNAIYAFKDSVVNKLTSGVETLVRSYGIDIKSGHASFTGKNQVKVGGETIEFKKAVIATGSKSIMPKFMSVEGFSVDSTFVLEHPEMGGKNIVIIGAGVIGCELAFILNSFGSQVTMVEKMKTILPTEDKDCIRAVESSLKNKGIKVLTDISVEKIEKGRITLSNNELIEADYCVVAVGRIPNTDGLDSAKAGVKIGEKKEIVIDNNFKTSNPDIYAVGDVTGSIQLAHYASACACRVVVEITGNKSPVPNINAIPRVTYSIPELASVGLTETQAKSSNVDYKVGRFSYAASGKAMSMDETEGMVKVLVDTNDKIIGAAVVGADADNLIVPFTMAIALGLTASELTTVVYPHPTLSEMILEACEDVHNRAIHKAGRRRS
ncbi:MAG: dihydrolipoyl dehydrogenase [Proteobacteria bacterium]|nr:dihydrolipoyl dehydrogenase [Pseudomonadota bacterium]